MVEGSESHAGKGWRLQHAYATGPPLALAYTAALYKWGCCKTAGSF